VHVASDLNARADGYLLPHILFAPARLLAPVATFILMDSPARVFASLCYHLRPYHSSWEDVELSRGPARPGSNPGPAERHLSSFIRAVSRVRLGFLVVSFFRISCVFLHVERGRRSKRVWRSLGLQINI
jgi:hypothetical protein